MVKTWAIYIDAGKQISSHTSLVNRETAELVPIANFEFKMKVLILLCLVAAAVAQEVYAPIPYSFNYKADTEDGGSSGHQESGDGNGKVQGSYTVTDLEGHVRTVDYVADELGFRASIRTNEPGTANLNPADVTVDSSADDNGIAAAYAGVIAPAAPQPRPAVRPAARTGVRYVLVPATDPRAAGYV